MVKGVGVKRGCVAGKVKDVWGGNEEKIGIGKWLVGEGDVYLFDE